MSNNLFFLIFAVLFLNSCGTQGRNVKSQLGKKNETYHYTDKSGVFQIKIASGLDKKGKVYFTKKSMSISDSQKEKILEKSIVLSDVGIVKNTPVLRPKKSQYTVWFDGKKYFSELTVIPEKKAIEVKTQSPEAKENGIKTITFPNTKTVPCFFSQVIECAEISGFIDMASKKEDGSMSLLIIWEGFPFLNETFSDFPVELFSQGQLEYDGKTNESERKFNLRVAGQSIVFVINDKNEMIKMFWVTQGISMVAKSLQGKAAVSEDPDFE